MSRDTLMHVGLDEIEIGAGRREVDGETVNRLAKSIKSIGLQHPITVRSKNGVFELIAGRHRVEAFRKLGIENIPATVVRWGDIDVELWEISENLHRADLTALQRSEQVARWIELRKQQDILRQPDAKPGRPEGGMRAAARDLEISEADARRSVDVSQLAPEAKEAAREAGLDNNRTALLAASRAEPAQQAAVIRDIAERKAAGVEADVKQRAAKEVAQIIAEHVPGELWDGLKANLYAAGANAVANALTNLTGQSVMDRRYA